MCAAPIINWNSSISPALRPPGRFLFWTSILKMYLVSSELDHITPTHSQVGSSSSRNGVTSFFQCVLPTSPQHPFFTHSKKNTKQDRFSFLRPSVFHGNHILSWHLCGVKTRPQKVFQMWFFSHLYSLLCVIPFLSKVFLRLYLNSRYPCPTQYCYWDS